MKWVNLVERQPVGIATYVVLKIGDKRCLFADINSIRGSGGGEEYHVDTYGWQEWVPKSNIEWLDETPRYLTELPAYNKWEDVEELFTMEEDYEIFDDIKIVFDWLKQKHPYGIKVGDKYIQK